MLSDLCRETMYERVEVSLSARVKIERATVSVRDKNGWQSSCRKSRDDPNSSVSTGSNGNER